MAGQSALWWVKSNAANGLEATAVNDITNWADGEIVLFNETPVVTKGGNIFQTRMSFRNSVPENSKVDGNNNDVQDMGLDGVDVIITGMIKDSDSANDSISKIMSWMNEKKTTTGYTEGRFGLRLDDFPAFNMIPTPTYGYIPASLEFGRVGETTNRAGFILALRVGGDVRGWLDANGFSAE